MYHPLVEVYIQNLEPDDQFGWVRLRRVLPRSVRPWGDAEAAAAWSDEEDAGPHVAAHGRAEGEVSADGFAAMAAPDWGLLGRTGTNSDSCGASSWGRRGASCSTSSRSATAARILGTHLGRGSRLHHHPIQRHQPQHGSDAVEFLPPDAVIPRRRLAINVLPGVWLHPTCTARKPT